jgi:hypothetical protein
MGQPNEAEWIYIKRTHKYLPGTRNYGVLYGARISKRALEAFRTRRSTSGVCAVCRQCNCMVTPTATVSDIATTVTEFIATSEGAKKLLWLKHLLGELGGKSSVVPTLYVDNASMVKLAKNSVS